MSEYYTVSTKLAKVLVIVFLFGTIPSISASGLCYVLETNQTLQHYCEWSNWFPWNCLFCGRGIPGSFSLASRTRSICCDQKLLPESCRDSCKVTNDDVKQTGICETECPHLYYTTAKLILPSTTNARTSTSTVTSKADLHRITSPSTTLHREIQPISTLPRLIRSSSTNLVVSTSVGVSTSHKDTTLHIEIQSTSTLPRLIRSSTTNLVMSTSNNMSTSKVILEETSAKTSTIRSTTFNETCVPNKTTLPISNASSRLAQTILFRSTIPNVATTDLNVHSINQTSSIFISRKTTNPIRYITSLNSSTKSTPVTTRKSKGSQNILSSNSTTTAPYDATLNSLYTPTALSPLLNVSVPVSETASKSHGAAQRLPEMATNYGTTFPKDITHESPTFNAGLASPQSKVTAVSQSTVNRGLALDQSTLTVDNKYYVNNGQVSSQTNTTASNQYTQHGGLAENIAGHGNSSILWAVVHTHGMSSDDQCCYLWSWRLYSRGSLRLCLFILVSFYVTIATTGFLVVLRIVMGYNNRKSRVHTNA
ncbi:mucin-5AC-like [Dreissena polymorpha]|uniref:mucin-5AC-like n=1 Tax=Dreissena polymorpha TaxID=45954 RepID=UPI0022647917|nr:mucin-5AC-like [Dreissena polymorpha]